MFSSPRPDNDVFMLSFQQPEGEKQWIPLVHVSKKLQPYFAAGEVATFEFHRLAHNGAAMRELPAQPERLVTAVETKDGRRCVDIPARMVWLNETSRPAVYLAYCAAAALFVTGLVVGGLMQGDCAVRMTCALSPKQVGYGMWALALALPLTAHGARWWSRSRVEA